MGREARKQDERGDIDRFTAINEVQGDHRKAGKGGRREAERGEEREGWRRFLGAGPARGGRVGREVRALRAAGQQQLATGQLLQRRPFQRVVREVAGRVGPPGLRIQSLALAALQEAAEAVLVGLLEAAGLASRHGGRVTLQPKDLGLVRRIRRQTDGF
jgi:histone H3/H4